MLQPLPDLESLSREELLTLLKGVPRREPSLPGAEDVGAMRDRNARLEILYYLAERNRPGHSMRGLVAGLEAAAPF